MGMGELGGYGSHAEFPVKENHKYRKKVSFAV